MKVRHLTSIRDLSSADVTEVFRLAADMKRSPDRYTGALAGKTLAMIFQKPSTRTRVSFEVGIYQLGGIGLHLSGNDLQLGRGETIADTARVLSRYVDAIMARTHAHQDIVELARDASVPVINGLSDLLHPCQALADYFTLLEHKQTLRGRKIAYVGDGNNMCHSLLYGANKVGMHIAVATPQGYEPKSIIMKSVQREAQQVGVQVTLTEDPGVAVEGADAVYTDVWASMGQEAEAEVRKGIFRPYQVNASLMARAKPDAVFMHCLPAHRGEEVSAEVIDGPQSIVFDQAENRLHVQKAILHFLLR
ncbi:MAG TPA: ornithine carbamoyltransferase [Vicinamibacteria bacterium]|nr:ornithine carbamoyltransferase [Vicinamibacteria bacterium]